MFVKNYLNDGLLTVVVCTRDSIRDLLQCVGLTHLYPPMNAPFSF